MPYKYRKRSKRYFNKKKYYRKRKSLARKVKKLSNAVYRMKPELNWYGRDGTGTLSYNTGFIEYMNGIVPQGFQYTMQSFELRARITAVPATQQYIRGCLLLIADIAPRKNTRTFGGIMTDLFTNTTDPWSFLNPTSSRLYRILRRKNFNLNDQFPSKNLRMKLFWKRGKRVMTDGTASGTPADCDVGPNLYLIGMSDQSSVGSPPAMDWVYRIRWYDS